MGAVPYARSAWIESDRDIQSEWRGQPAKLVDGQPRRNCSLDPAHLGLRDTGRPRELVLAESCLDARRPNLIADEAKDPLGRSAPSVARSFGAAHTPIMETGV